MNTRGFTLIELVTVLSVVAILALLAVPTFIDRNVRLQVEEGLALAKLAEDGVASFYRANDALPADNAEAGVPPKGKIVGNYVTEVSIDAGAVTITFGNNVNSSVAGKRLTRRPAIVKGEPTVNVAWLCHNAPVPNAMTVESVNRTDIPGKWLPIECRG